MEHLYHIRKEIHTALLCVSQLCEQFFRKYPQNYPLITTNIPQHQPYFYGGQNPLNPKFQAVSTKNQSQQQRSKKLAKQEKRNLKNLEKLRNQRQKQQRVIILRKMLKKKKKERKTKKNMIKKDPRYAEKPKFPLSPYLLFLQQMRAKNFEDNTESRFPNKQFAIKTGQKWRQMPPQMKKPYILAYLKEKNIYDEKLTQYYEKYPDLKPQRRRKYEPVYAVDDQKYNQAEKKDQQLETESVDELVHENKNSEDQKEKLQDQRGKNHNGTKGSNQDEQENQGQQYGQGLCCSKLCNCQKCKKIPMRQYSLNPQDYFSSKSVDIQEIQAVLNHRIQKADIQSKFASWNN